jgi:hypothetical protein
MSEKSTRRERFENVASKRVQKILDQIEILGNCSNRSNYEYTENDVQKMFAAIDTHLKLAKARFGNTTSKQDDKKFKF